jgi:hypothetical protein
MRSRISRHDLPIFGLFGLITLERVCEMEKSD